MLVQCELVKGNKTYVYAHLHVRVLNEAGRSICNVLLHEAHTLMDDVCGLPLQLATQAACRT